MSDTYVADGSREAVVAWLDTLGEYGQVYNLADSFIMHLYNAGFIISDKNWVDKQNELAVKDEQRIEALEKNLRMIHQAWDDYRNAEHHIDQAFALSSFANVVFATRSFDDLDDEEQELLDTQNATIDRIRTLVNGGKVTEVPIIPPGYDNVKLKKCPQCGSTDQDIINKKCDLNPNHWHY
jgi:hypothetical protein